MTIEGRLEVIEGSEKGTAVPLAAAPVTIGRAPGNSVVVKDAAVSRQHARIFERDGRHFVADLNSSHGTFVNGTKVTLQELHEGDELKLGATLFRYGSARREPPPVVESAPPKSLPPVNTSYRRALDESGEDPFALEEPTTSSAAPIVPPPPAPAPTRPPLATPSPAGAPLSMSPPGAPPSIAPPKGFDVAPQIELRGRTAEHFATRGAPPPAAAAAAAGVHVPPPLSSSGRRRRGPLSFFGDELDQRGRFARAIATLFALAVAGGLLWLTLQLTGGAPKIRPPSEEEAPTGPERPYLPPRH
jgi:predicted component of type VI protein secretion system